MKINYKQNKQIGKNCFDLLVGNKQSKIPKIKQQHNDSATTIIADEFLPQTLKFN